MKKQKMVLLLALVLIVSQTGFVQAKNKISLNCKSTTLFVGSTKKVKVKNAGKKKIRWSSSDSQVAEVKKGVVTAKAKGKAVITATVKKKKYKCKIQVVDALSAADFAVEIDGYHNYIDFVNANPTQFLRASTGDQTSRGVSIGSTKKSVIKQYGETKAHSMSFPSTFAMETLSDYKVSGSSYYYIYSYEQDGHIYQMLFFFDVEDKVKYIIIDRDYMVD